MNKRIIAFAVVAGLAALALLSIGCSPDTNLGGTPVPNLEPDTQVTARPPDLLEGGFVVQFYWTGYDPDGRVRGYQWKLSNDGTDGISVQDTLTFDPVTGDTLNPWHFTAGTDTTLLVSAELDSFPGDPVGVLRSYQVHSFFVRAVDENGAVDPTPAYISFTATTLLPKVAIAGPSTVVAQTGPTALPSTVTLKYTGIDQDPGGGLPTKVRFLWIPAILPGIQDTTYAAAKIQVVENMDALVSFADSAWGPWIPFPKDPEVRTVTFTDNPARDSAGRTIFYLFAAQAMDTTGAVSVDKVYGVSVGHVQIRATSPTLQITETYLPSLVSVGLNGRKQQDIATGQVVSFSWVASAANYAGSIVSYRYGWDVVDVNNPDDPGWAVLPGNSLQHRRSVPQAFTSGTHTLTVEVKDNSDQLTRAEYILNVVPIPDPVNQYPLAMIDDVYDHNSNQWVSSDNQRALDNDVYRDEFWMNVLTTAGGVANFVPIRDSFDTEEARISYRIAVDYRVLIWASRYTSTSYISGQLRPETPLADGRFNWLTSYQDRVGNLLYCSTRGMMNFLASTSRGYAMPVIFQSTEGNDNGGFDGDGPRVGFGRHLNPDGTYSEVNVTRYPYRVWGLSVIDDMSPNSSDKLYGTSPYLTVRVARKPHCVGLKGLALDPEFKTRHMPGGATFADSIYTDLSIDYRDLVPDGTDGYNNLRSSRWGWGDDEFYDVNINPLRSTYWQYQQCSDSPLDSMACIEPMFRSIARLNWIRKLHLDEDPESQWPHDGSYTLPLSQMCGVYALNNAQESALTNGLPVGILTYKSLANKPSQVGDVAWGFDPYRFDHTQMTNVIRWVLGSHFHLTMTGSVQ